MGKDFSRGLAKVTMSFLIVSLVSIMGATATCLECQASNTTSESYISGVDSFNTMLDSNSPSNSATTYGLNKKCFRSCIRETWPYLPNWVKRTCGGVCRSCMNGNLLSCAGCYGCTLGYAVGCANECL